jgi:hypothetical protein
LREVKTLERITLGETRIPPSLKLFQNNFVSGSHKSKAQIIAWVRPWVCSHNHKGSERETERESKRERQTERRKGGGLR